MTVIHGGFSYNFRAVFTKVHGSIIYLFILKLSASWNKLYALAATVWERFSCHI